MAIEVCKYITMMVDDGKILDVAYRLFRERGIRLTRFQQVASVCGTSVWKIKQVFRSKKVLVLSVVRHTLNKKTNYLYINPSLSPSAVSELNNFYRFIEDHITELGPEMLSDLRHYHPLVLDQLHDLVDSRLVPYIQRNIERGLSEGFYRDDLDYELYVATYFNMLRTILKNDSLDWKETKRIIRHLHDIYFHSTLNVKGMRI